MDDFNCGIILNAKSVLPDDVDPEFNDGVYINPLTKKQTVSFSKNIKRRKYTEKERAELEKIYQRVVVNDYGDDYHLSEEQRKINNMYYEAFSKIRRCKKKYRKLDEYVRVYRYHLDCLKTVAEHNGIYNPEDFILKVIKGDIKVYGLTFPKYIGKNKKDINWEYIADFIMDYSLDPKELAMEHESELDEFDEDEIISMIFDDGEYDKLLDIIENDTNDLYIDEELVSRDDVALVADNDETKELIKFSPIIVKRIKDAIKDERHNRARDGRLNSFVFEMHRDDFEKIRQIDEERGYRSSSDIPKFKGNIMNDDDYNKYIYELETYDRTKIKLNYHGKERTQDEIDDIEIKDLLEENGWNIRKLYRQKDEERKLKKIYEKDKKREEKLKKQLLEVQKRNKKRKNKSGIVLDCKKKDKKKKKKKKDKESD